MVAVGASPILPPLPGMDGDKVVVANDLSDTPERVGENVVVLGGGLVGCETASHLALEGMTVTVVETMPQVAPESNGRYRPILLNKLKEMVTVKTGIRGLRVTDDGLICADGEGQERLFRPEN